MGFGFRVWGACGLWQMVSRNTGHNIDPSIYMYIYIYIFVYPQLIIITNVVMIMLILRVTVIVSTNILIYVCIIPDDRVS